MKGILLDALLNGYRKILGPVILTPSATRRKNPGISFG